MSILNFLRKISIKKALLCVLGSAILAFGLYNVHSVSDVTEGGVLGLVLLLEHAFGVSPSLTSILLNIACFAFGAFVLGAGFILYSAISAAAFSAFYALFELFPRVYPAIAEHPLLAAILGAVFVGVGVGLCVRAGGAPTGDDALAMGMSKKTGVRIELVYLVSDLCVLILSLTYIPVKRILYSLVTVVLSGQIIGFFERTKKVEKKETGSGRSE